MQRGVGREENAVSAVEVEVVESELNDCNDGIAERAGITAVEAVDVDVDGEFFEGEIVGELEMFKCLFSMLFPKSCSIWSV